MAHLQKLTLHHNEFTGQVPNEVCALRNNGNIPPESNYGKLHFLWVDCSPMPTTNEPKVDCPIADCCSICFEGYDDDGGPSTGGSSPPETNVSHDTPHSVQNDESSELKDMLSNASHDGGASLMDISSPQFRAYAWLVEDSKTYEESSGGNSYSHDRLVQRYALATLYFAANGAHWTKSDNWLTNTDECSWYGISGCTDADIEKIISIDLKRNHLDGTIPPKYLVSYHISSC